MTNDLVLELSTDPEQIRYTHLQNSSAWRAKLTAEEYADREWLIGCESKLGKRKVDENLGLYHFVLRDKSIASSGKFGDIVASCETMNRKAWRIDPKGELVEVVAACIGGVFTLEPYRGKGYACTMISLLNRYWDERLDKRGFMFLYSEVGDYYSRVGYESAEVKVHELHNLEQYRDPELDLDVSDYHFLKYEDYSTLVELQYKNAKEFLISKSKQTDKVLYSLIPNIDTYTWFHDRDLFIASKLRAEKQVDHFGVTLNDGTHDRVVWLHDWSSDDLTIVALTASSHESFKKLLNLSISEAISCKFDSIHIWHSGLGQDPETVAANVKFLESNSSSKLFQDNSSRSAIRPLDGSPLGTYSWEFNDKWCWF